jgi:hypothetical protein
MDTSDELSFVNRNEELTLLENCIQSSLNKPLLLVIRSPAGFGKSSLTDQLRYRMNEFQKKIVSVDPSIRIQAGTITLHDGLYLQKIADVFNRNPKEKKSSWPPLNSYLKRKKKLIKSKKKLDLASEYPGLKSAYKHVYDYIARASVTREYSPENLLKSDSVEAVQACADYVESIIKNNAIVLILREAQHIDLYSLRYLSSLLTCSSSLNLIFEYTSTNNEFSPEHQKIFLEVGGDQGNVKIFDIKKMGLNHLEELIKANVSGNFSLTSEYYSSWDGNLRSVIEMQYRVGVSKLLTRQEDSTNSLSNLMQCVIEHIDQLLTIEKLVLAIILVHIESINKSTILHLTIESDGRESRASINEVLRDLEKKHKFINCDGRSYAISNDTVAKALWASISMQGVIAISEKKLRDYYKEIISGGITTVGLYDAVRQLFRLCAKTKDIQGVSWAVDVLSNEIKKSHDQSIYIDVISSAIESDPGLYRDHNRHLLDWASELAYATSDWERCEQLISLKSSQEPYAITMRACALQEIGRHDEALSLIEKINTKSALLGSAYLLVKALIIGGQGLHEECRNILEGIVNIDNKEQNPLIGYAYRFFEIVDNRESSLENLLKSIYWFDYHGLRESKSYSELAAAMLLARKGEIVEAKKYISYASKRLSKTVRDQHILLNNKAAVELLTSTPDFRACCTLFSSALKFANDDFSELTIRNNLCISLLETCALASAVDCAEKCIRILSNPDFVDKNIFWPVCHNLALIYNAVGDYKKAQEIKSIPLLKLPRRIDDQEYWMYRYDASSIAPESHEFLCGKPWHPVYLSHWLIDLEGINFLKQEVVE